MSGMARGLLDHVHHDPAQAPRFHFVQVLAEILQRRHGDYLFRPGDLLLVERADALDRVGLSKAKIDVLIRLVFGPREADRITREVHLKPPALHVRQMLDDSQQGGRRRYESSRRLLPRQALELPEDRLPVAVEESAEHRLLIAGKGNVEPAMRDNVRRDHRDILGPRGAGSRDWYR